MVNTTTSAAETAALSSAGWLCVPPDDQDVATRCYDGYGVQAMQAAATSLGWTLRPVLDHATAPLLGVLGPPTVMSGPSGSRWLQMGLVTSLQNWRDAEAAAISLDGLACSQSLLAEVVCRAWHALPGAHAVCAKRPRRTGVQMCRGRQGGAYRAHAAHSVWLG